MMPGLPPPAAILACSSATARTRSVMSLISLTMPRGYDAVLLVVLDLDGAATVGLVDRGLHRAGHGVGVHDDLTVDVAGGAADRLDQRALRAEEAFLVGVEDGDQRDLGQVEPFAQEVDADDDVVDAKPQVAQDLDPLQRVDLAVQVVGADAHLLQVVGKILGHALGQRRHQRALARARRVR